MEGGWSTCACVSLCVYVRCLVGCRSGIKTLWLSDSSDEEFTLKQLQPTMRRLSSAGSPFNNSSRSKQGQLCDGSLFLHCSQSHTTVFCCFFFPTSLDREGSCLDTDKDAHFVCRRFLCIQVHTHMCRPLESRILHSDRSSWPNSWVPRSLVDTHYHSGFLRGQRVSNIQLMHTSKGKRTKML